MKTLLSFLLIFAAGCSLRASAQIVSTCDTVRFGNIIEAEGPKTVRAYVKNIGQSPAALLKVRPTCGCTAADFRKDEILPGDSAWIDLTYNPNRRPGGFEKGVKVYPVEGEMIRLPITGTVFASEATLDLLYPGTAGPLRVAETTLVPPAPISEQKTFFLDVYNPCNEPLTAIVESHDEAVETQSFPEIIPPGEKGIIGIYINPAKEQRRGPIEYKLSLFDTPITIQLTINDTPGKRF